MVLTVGLRDCCSCKVDAVRLRFGRFPESPSVQAHARTPWYQKHEHTEPPLHDPRPPPGVSTLPARWVIHPLLSSARQVNECARSTMAKRGRGGGSGAPEGGSGSKNKKKKETQQNGSAREQKEDPTPPTISPARGTPTTAAASKAKLPVKGKSKGGGEEKSSAKQKKVGGEEEVVTEARAAEDNSSSTNSKRRRKKVHEEAGYEGPVEEDSDSEGSSQGVCFTWLCSRCRLALPLHSVYAELRDKQS